VDYRNPAYETQVTGKAGYDLQPIEFSRADRYSLLILFSAATEVVQEPIGKTVTKIVEKL
jgi:hypothetical protein